MNARLRVLVAAAVVLAATTACDGSGPPAGQGGRPVTTPASSSPTLPTGAGCAAPPAATAEAGSEVVPGPSNGLPRSTAKAESLVVEAVVLERDCDPATGAEIHLWHTDSRGLYRPAGTQACCYYDGNVRTDRSGRFRIRTIRPAQYPVPDAPPAHIHLDIRHPAGPLETEIIFVPRPPTGTAGPTGHDLPVVPRRDGSGWRVEAVFVLAGTG